MEKRADSECRSHCAKCEEKGRISEEERNEAFDPLPASSSGYGLPTWLEIKTCLRFGLFGSRI
ncbi:hypothetical protein KFK09_022082 [Dendrobium nobile]|uniref:Uncharacterized protein n=1 Tax=Dendrobium nobile TaxID=94219 RepID=A0A8T3AHP0_DENNO|nr:hypothetical protein KFK09_022082 [Dendrobium nobile]